MTRESKTSPRSPVAFENVFNVELKARNKERRAGFRRVAAAGAAGGPCRNDPLPPLELVEIRLDDLKLAARRLRRRDPAHVREIANAIARLGYSRPILVGRDNEVIDGESVVAAARLLGFDRLTCVRVEHLSASEQRVLRLAINRLAEKGEWDLESLKIEFEELVVVEAPIEIAGFAGDEIDNVLSLGGDNEDGVERGPLSPEAGAQPTARVGHLYQLGPHRLICGDATDPAVLRRLLRAGSPARGEQPVDAIARARPTVRIVLTDEPYNVPIAGHVTGGRHREFAMASGEMTPSEYLAFNEAWMAASLPHVISGGLLATFIDWRVFRRSV